MAEFRFEINFTKDGQLCEMETSIGADLDILDAMYGVLDEYNDAFGVELTEDNVIVAEEV